MDLAECKLKKSPFPWPHFQQSVHLVFLDLKAGGHFALRIIDELGNINKTASYSPTQHQNVTEWLKRKKDMNKMTEYTLNFNHYKFI